MWFSNSNTNYYLAVLLAWWVSAVAATSNNLTDLVTWDNYSLSINGSR